MQILKSITLENFRVFKNSHEIEIKPLTVLIGPNSSGKSSVIKSMILGKNNSANGLSNLDFTGPKHNLGNIYNTTNNTSDSPFITIGYSFDFTIKPIEINRLGLFRDVSALHKINRLTTRGSYQRLIVDKKREKVTLKILLKYLPNEGSGELTQVEFYLEDGPTSFVKFMLNDGESINHKLIIDFDQINDNKILKSIFLSPINRFSNLNSEKKEDNKKMTSQVKSELRGINTYRVSTDEYDNVSQKNPIDICKDLYFKMYTSIFGQSGEQEVSYWNYHTRQVANIFHEYIGMITDNSDFIEAIRANTRRVYTNDSQGTSFNDLILEYKSRRIESAQLEFINSWLNKFEIADEIVFENIEGVATTIFLKRRDKKIALADLGFGATQILPLILKISMESVRKNSEQNGIFEAVDKIMMLEEPETNLHPKLQTLLADFLFDATQKFAIQFIIETHSEYLVRKLQIMVAEETLLKDDVKIYYFNPEEDENGKVTKEINILDNGSLSDDFGYGFWDEATRLQIELMKLKRGRNE